MHQDWYDMNIDPAIIHVERRKARELKKTNWWKSLLQQGVCHYCHGHFSPKELTMDHIVPLARGGKSSKGNIVLCCKSCNNKKKYNTPVDLLIAELEEKNKNETENEQKK